MHPIDLNDTSNRNIIILYHGDVILHTISQGNDIIKRIIKNLYRLSKSYDVKSKIKSKNKKEGGEQTVSDVKNLPVTLSPNISRIEENIVRIQAHSRHFNTYKVDRTSELENIINNTTTFHSCSNPSNDMQQQDTQ